MVLFFFPWAGIYLFIFDKGQEYFIFMKKYMFLIWRKGQIRKMAKKMVGYIFRHSLDQNIIRMGLVNESMCLSVQNLNSRIDV
jgi:hypothetical protein